MAIRTLVAVFLLMSLSCVEKKSTIIPEKSEEPAVAFCSISFFSIGYGIDVQGLKSVKEWAEQKKDSIGLEQTPWGREGEVDLLLLSKHNEVETQRWLTELKGLLERANNCKISVEKIGRK